MIGEEVRSLNITGSCVNGTLTLRFSGELDHHFAGYETGVAANGREALSALTERIDAFLPRTCVLDLRELTFMDSSGIALILRAEREMRDLRGKLILERVPEQPMRVLRAAGLQRLAEIRE